MINKDLEVKFFNGSILKSEKIIFFSDMTQNDIFNFQDKILNSLWEKSISSNNIAKKAEENALIFWLKCQNQ